MLKKLVLLAVAGALAISACAAAAPKAASEPEFGGSTAGYGYDADGSVAGSPPIESPAAEESAQRGAAIERLIIKNASLSLVVADPAESVNAITAMAEGLGGFVVSSYIYQASTDAAGQKIMGANLTIRVPVDRLPAALEQLKGMAVEVRSENVSGEDVTAQFTDLESQLRNLEAAEAQLQKIMDGATKTEDVLSVYNQLVAIRGQIEQIKGQMKYLSESAAMSAISLDLIPDALSQPVTVGGWKPEGVAKEALEALLRSLQGIATAAIWGVVYLLPLALVIGLPAYLIVRAAARRIRKTPKATTA